MLSERFGVVFSFAVVGTAKESVQGGGKEGDGVRRERTVTGSKLVRRRKQDRLGRWGFAIAGRQDRGSMR